MKCCICKGAGKILTIREGKLVEAPCEWCNGTGKEPWDLRPTSKKKPK